MAGSSEKPKISVRLFVDEEKNVVVLAEADKDFVDVLFSLLTLPMGTIVRLLEKHQKARTTAIGCFNNLYTSVANMGSENFQTEACKQMLLYPRSADEDKCRKLKLNIDDTEAAKRFVCSGPGSESWCDKLYSNYNTSRCACGSLMDKEIQFSRLDRVADVAGETSDGVFVSGMTSFIVTDDLKVTNNSIGMVLSLLKGLGYADDVDKLREIVLDVGSEEVLALLDCLFTSDAPLTDAFLRKRSSDSSLRERSSDGLSKTCTTTSPPAQEKRDKAKPGEEITLSVFVRKQDGKILYAECGEDFLDLLFTFLAVPLGSVLEISCSNINIGSIGNLSGSFRSIRLDEQMATKTSKCILPLHYSCQKNLLDLTTTPKQLLFLQPISGYRKHSIEYDPKSQNGVPSTRKGGFVRKGAKFVVSDDLIIEPRNSTSTPTVCWLKKLRMDLNDLEERVISIGKAEAIGLLRDSFMTSSALTNGLQNLLAKKRKEET